MKKSILLLLLSSIIMLLPSCESAEVEPGPYLSVSVEGVLSGKKRNNVRVTLYTSKNDAQYEMNPVDYDYSDSDGNATFSNLEYRTYWARANTILGTNKTIREIDITEENNELTLPVL